MARTDGQIKTPKRDLDRQLDRLEASIAELRILYEQYFSGIIPQAPDKQHTEVARTIRVLLKAPFKNSATRFRLRTLINRFQTYCTYWEKVNKQREAGTYYKDIFKAEMRERQQKEMEQLASQVGASERGLRQLYSTYEDALRKNNGNLSQLNFDHFKKSMLKTAQDLKKKHGAQKVHYKVVVSKNGQVKLKASTKKKK